jgi:hypothetical protein
MATLTAGGIVRLERRKGMGVQVRRTFALRVQKQYFC